jgi:hypothetical protein
MNPYRTNASPARRTRILGPLMALAVCSVGALALAGATAPVVGCAGAASAIPSFVSQFPQFDDLYVCVKAQWGQPLDQIISKCGTAFGAVIIDIVADIAIVAGLLGTPKDPYAGDVRVQAAARARIPQAASSAVPAPIPAPSAKAASSGR